MAKRIGYRLTQGQKGIRGGFLTDGPSFVSGKVAVADMPLEIPFFVAPEHRVPDEFDSLFRDQDPSPVPAPAFKIGAIRAAFGAAFTATANAFKVLVKRYTSAGTLVGTVATIVDASATSITAAAMIEKKGADLANESLDPGDVLTIRVEVTGTGAATPAFGGYCDTQA